MARTFSQPLLKELFSQESGDPFLFLTSFTHPSFSEINLVNNNADIVSKGKTYMAFAMKLTLPVDDGQTIPTIQIVLDNVTVELIDELRKVVSPIGVKLQAVLASRPDVVELEISDLLLSSISYDNKKITGTLTLNDFINQRIPSHVYSPAYFPGLFG